MSNMKQVMRFVLVALFMGIITIIGNSAHVNAEAENPIELGEEEALAQDAEMYAADWNISLEEAMRRLALQAEIGELGAILAEEYPETFAGFWIQHEPYQIIAQFTEKVTPTVVNEELAGMLEIRVVAHSLQELESAQEEAHDSVASLGEVADSDINIKENRVEIYTLDAQSLTATLERARKTVASPVLIVESEDLAVDEAYIYGGLPLRTCTSGWGVKQFIGGSTRGITTAAHCSNNQTYNGTALTFRSQLYTGPYDIQWHTTNAYNVTNKFKSGTNNTRRVTATENRNSQSVGDYVCKYGKTTGYTCGYIITKNYRSSATPNGTATYIRVSRDGTDLSSGGDSGGPWFNGYTAYGTHKSGIGDDAIYMAVNYVLGLGVYVLTSP